MIQNGINRSPLFYVGDKYKLIKEIKTHFPDKIGRFVEPFVGGGSVFLNVDAREFILNDIDSYVIALHKYLCNQSRKSDLFFENLFNIIDDYGLSCSFHNDIVPVELKTRYPKTYFAKYNKNAYIKLRTDYNQSDRSDISVLYILLIYGFNRMLRFNRFNDFNLPVGNVDFNKNVYDALKRYFEIVSVKQPKWFNEDFRTFLNDINWQEDDFVYLDPPYLITFSEYNKLWNEDTEADLLSFLDRMNGMNVKFAISNVTHYKGKTNDSFLSWARQYNSYPIKSNYISYHDNTIKQFNEVLITNY
ncbi:MAG: Dam family site-specific DNA-(adenine-N6)-methyltransferase [Prevotellaceae bacterium]|nr:Dam family site-specific DNA-(adenine-N6)-methyltransferase [Prevotellaceae bacterium]